MEKRFDVAAHGATPVSGGQPSVVRARGSALQYTAETGSPQITARLVTVGENARAAKADQDRKSTRLNSSHSQISYAVFCLKKKKIAMRNCLTRSLTSGVRTRLLTSQI